MDRGRFDGGDMMWMEDEWRANWRREKHDGVGLRLR